MKLSHQFLLLSGVIALSQIPIGAEEKLSSSRSVGNGTVNACIKQPFDGRELYLRGSLNSWNARESERFSFFCNRYELVADIQGEHTFKIADEAWTIGSDLSGESISVKSKLNSSDKQWRLKYAKPGMQHLFSGSHRISINMTDAKNPTLTISTCDKAPYGKASLHLRGTMNNWTPQDDYAFQFSCDAYYLNVNIKGKHEFKVMAEKISLAGTSDATVTHNKPYILQADSLTSLTHDFNGEATIRIAMVGSEPVMTIGPKSFANPNESTIIDPIALSVSHNSRNLAHKAPFGAVTEGTDIGFAVSALAGAKSVTLVIEKRTLEGNQDVLEYTSAVRVPLAKTIDASQKEKQERWSGRHTFKDTHVYGYYFEIVIAGKSGDKTYIYQNNRDSIYWTREKGSGGIGQIEEKSMNSIRRFRQTIYRKDFKVPDWAPDVIYYYIFPERFRNGDRSNDPKPGTTRYQNKTVEFHKNWLDTPYKPKSGDGSDDTYNNDFFGGDLTGIIEKLDYIKELGANAIYMTPVFHAASNHKYDTADYKNIDPHFGTNADFEKLTKEAAKRGIRVIPDTSLNHVGSDSIYFNRYGNFKANGAFTNSKITSDSTYASWFTFDAKQKEPDRQFKGWVGVTDLPEVNKSDKNFREFAYGAKDSVMKLWLDRGAAGWRMDVVPWVPDDFWREWRTAIKTHTPDALTVAETWFDSSKYFLGDTFDSTMNYIFRSTVLDYANGGDMRVLYRNLESIREAYPPQVFYALMNLHSSHDQPRSLHHFGYLSTLNDQLNDKTDASKISLAKKRLRLTFFFQMVYPGSPAIYYGDEVGVTGGEDPYNRATYPWADLGGKPDTALLADVKALTQMRHEHAVLRRGSISAPIHLGANVVVLARQLNDNWAITAMNNAETEKIVRIKLPSDCKAERFVDALTQRDIRVVDGSIELRIPPLFGSALISR